MQNVALNLLICIFFHCKYRRKGKKPSSASLFLKVMDRNCKILCRFGANTLEKSCDHKRSQYSHCCSRKNSKKTSQLLGLDLGTQGWILPPGIMSMPLHYCRHTPFVGMGNSLCTRTELCCAACSVPRGYSQGTHICKWKNANGRLFCLISSPHTKSREYSYPDCLQTFIFFLSEGIFSLGRRNSVHI